MSSIIPRLSTVLICISATFFASFFSNFHFLSQILISRFPFQIHDAVFSLLHLLFSFPSHSAACFVPPFPLSVWTLELKDTFLFLCFTSSFFLHQCTVVQNSQESRCKYWATDSSVYLFARTVCFARALCCACSLADSLTPELVRK